jgi:uncharacterized membrane protein YfcA
LLVLGSCAGFLAGLLGIGGGMMMVPFMTMLLGAKGFPPQDVVKMAIATALATICFTSISSVLAHHRRGAVRWDIVKVLVPGVIIGSYLGAWLATLINSRALALFFAVFVGYAATGLVRGRKPKPTRQLPGSAPMAAAGGMIGAFAGMTGAGGAFVSVPLMTACNVPIHHAVATSAAIGFPVAVAGSISYIVNGMHLSNTLPGAFGYIYLPALVVISAASVVLAPLGARTAHRLNVRALQRAFGALLYTLAAYMLYKAWRG